MKIINETVTTDFELRVKKIGSLYKNSTIEKRKELYDFFFSKTSKNKQNHGYKVSNGE